MASFGLSNQILTLYLESLLISQVKIGLFMTLTLIGDALISYYLTWNADKLGRRFVMLFGTVMMFASGMIFALYSNYFVLLFAAIVGVISPSGNETGPFKSVEEASIAHLTPHNHRPEIFAFYGLFATAGAAAGSLVCGYLVDYLNLSWRFEFQSCYRIMFGLYSVVAIIKFGLMCLLSPKCEIYTPVEDSSTSNSETSSLLPQQQHNQDQDQQQSSGMSKTTKYYLPRLLAIFMLDSLGYGFMPSAWVIYYLKKTFEVTATVLGMIFFVTNAIDAISSLPSAYLAKALGPVKAILFTQAPSAIFFIIITFMNNFATVTTLLILYFATSTMDVVPRQVLLTSIMPKHEITKVMGIVNIGKTFATCVGPIVTGKLASHHKLRFGFLINGSCVLLADLIMAISFVHLDKEILTKQAVDHNIE
jgi:MFS family permease